MSKPAGLETYARAVLRRDRRRPAPRAQLRRPGLVDAALAHARRLPARAPRGRRGRRRRHRRRGDPPAMTAVSAPPGGDRRTRSSRSHRCATCASRSPTSATSAARTACRSRGSVPGTASCRAAEALDAQEIVRLAASVPVARRDQDPPDRRRAAAAHRPRRDRRGHRRARRARYRADHQRRAAPALGGAPSRRGAASGDGEPRLARSRGVFAR